MKPEREADQKNNSQLSINIKNDYDNQLEDLSNNQLGLKEKQLKIVQINCPPPLLNTFYIHGDIVVCLKQLSCLNVCRKFHHNNIYRVVNNIRIWRPQNFQNQQQIFIQPLIEASIEKPLSSFQDYKGLAESLILHGQNEQEYLFGQTLMDWYNQGQKLIQFVKYYYNLLREQKLLDEYIEQEHLYKNELLQLIFQILEQQSCKQEFFQYNIIEFNKKTCQYETTRIGISKGLSCLLGADEQSSQQIIIRNGAFEFLDNSTNLKILRQQLMWSSNMKQNNIEFQRFNNQNIDCFIEDKANLFTLDDYQIPCRLIFQRIPIQHDLLKKYPFIFDLQQSLFNTLRYFPYPDLVNLEIKTIEIEPQAINSLLQQRYQQINTQGDFDIEYLKDQLEYSVRSMDFIEKFYDHKLLTKKKRFRRKKGHVNDWDYLKHKYIEYKKSQSKLKNL